MTPASQFKMIIFIHFFVFLAAFPSFAGAVDYFQNVTGHLTNISSYPTSSLKIVYTIFRCHPVLAHLECNEDRPLKVQKYPVSDSGDFIIKELGIKGVIATERNELSWRFQVEYPDGLVSNDVDSDDYRAMNRSLSIPDDRILIRLKNFRSFRMPDMKVTIRNVDRNATSIEELKKFNARFFTRGHFNPACMTEYVPRSGCQKVILSNPFTVKGLAVHAFEGLDGFKSDLTTVEGVRIDDPNNPYGGIVYGKALEFSDIPVSQNLWEKDITVTLPELTVDLSQF